jgi:hypothetical protein
MSPPGHNPDPTTDRLTLTCRLALFLTPLLWVIAITQTATVLTTGTGPTPTTVYLAATLSTLATLTALTLLHRTRHTHDLPARWTALTTTVINTPGTVLGLYITLTYLTAP